MSPFFNMWKEKRRQSHEMKYDVFYRWLLISETAKQERPYPIFIKLPDDEEVKVIEITGYDKIDHMKGQIQCKTGIRPDLQRLKFNNKVLDDGAMTAAEADITKDCMLQLLPPPLKGGGKRGRATPIFDFEPLDADHAVVKTVLSKKLPCFRDFMNGLSINECEQLYKYIMGQKNHDRVVDYIVSMLPEASTIRSWHHEESHKIQLRFETCEEYLKSIVCEMLGQYKSRAGRWDMEALRIDTTENITSIRNDVRLASDASRMSLG
jgi:hypothetical protein